MHLGCHPLGVPRQPSHQEGRVGLPTACHPAHWAVGTEFEQQ